MLCMVLPRGLPAALLLLSALSPVMLARANATPCPVSPLPATCGGGGGGGGGGTPDFSLSVSPTNVNIFTGASNSATVTVTSLNGFADTVTLSATVSPSGPTTTFDPSSVYLTSYGTASSVITVSTAASTPTSSYTVTITGSSTGLTHYVSLYASVLVPFTISTGNLNLKAGSSHTQGVYVTSTNAYSGPASLTAVPSSNGLTSTLSPTSISLTSGGSATSNIAISSSNTLSNGTYSVTVSGTGTGGATSSFTMNVMVCSSQPQNQVNYAGYELMGSCFVGSNAMIYDVYAEWYVQPVSQPSDVSCAPCVLATWVGLSNDEYGSNGIVQVGTESIVNCQLNCSYSYDAVYLLWTSNNPAATVCMGVSSGDYITAEVENDARSGGSSTAYTITITDKNTGQTCHPVGLDFSQMGTPRYGLFMVERPLLRNNLGYYLSPLPQFQAVTFFYASYALTTGTGGSFSNYPIGNGWNAAFTMENQGYVNVLPSYYTDSVYGFYDLKCQWQMSQGT